MFVYFCHYCYRRTSYPPPGAFCRRKILLRLLSKYNNDDSQSAVRFASPLKTAKVTMSDS